MARRRNNRWSVQHATEIGIGMAVLVALFARYALVFETTESVRVGILAGAVAFGFWLVLPLLEWMWRQGTRLLKLNRRWWVRRKGGLAAFVGTLLDWLFPGRGAGRRSSTGRASRSQTREQQVLQHLSPRAFEELCAAIARAWGYEARRVGRSGDGGVDVEMWRDGEFAVAQCKHYYDRNVPVTQVRDFYGTMMHRGAARGYFFTTGRFSDGTYEFVEGKPLALIDREYLERILTQLEHRRGERGMVS
ncbi:MAG: restriction endonuclease [Ardenticatenaceae bacterium]